MRCALCWSTCAGVLFGEALPSAVFRSALAAAQGLRPGDVMLVVGTSNSVYPAAGLPDVAREAGATVIEVQLNRKGMGEALANKGHGFMAMAGEPGCGGARERHPHCGAGSRGAPLARGWRARAHRGAHMHSQRAV
jgi:hypothetical protein